MIEECLSVIRLVALHNGVRDHSRIYEHDDISYHMVLNQITFEIKSSFEDYDP